MRYALGIGTQIAMLRGTIARVQQTYARYRALDADPRNGVAITEARASWIAWQRELGSKAEVILAVLDHFQAEAPAPVQQEAPAPVERKRPAREAAPAARRAAGGAA